MLIQLLPRTVRSLRKKAGMVALHKSQLLELAGPALLHHHLVPGIMQRSARAEPTTFIQK